MDFKNTTISIDRPFTSYCKVQGAIGFLVRNRKSLINQHRISKRNYLNIGCGPHPHDDFINLDYWWNPKVDICWDVTKGIPLDDQSVRGIFTEHCFEHLDLNCMPKVLSECYRVLRPQGRIRISMPDGELYLHRYSAISQGKASLKLPLAETHSFQGHYSPILSVNRIFRDDGHRFIYDFAFLSQLLIAAGFECIQRKSFMLGEDPHLLIDREERVSTSFYVEAARPGC